MADIAPPPGFVLENAGSPPPPPGFELEHASESKQPEKSSALSRAWQANLDFNPAVAAVEGAANLATGAASGFVGAMAGSVTGIGHLIAEQAAGVPDAEEDAGTATRNVQNAIQDKFTYQPRGRGGQNVAAGVAAPFEAVAWGGNKAGEAITDTGLPGAPAVGAAVNAGIQAVPALLLDRVMAGKTAPKPLEKAKSDAANRLDTAGSVAPKVSEVAASDAVATQRAAGLESAAPVEPLKLATDLGYKVPPSKAGGKIGGTVEGLSGQVAFEKAASRANQRLTNKLAAEELGLPAETALTDAALARVKRPATAIYEKVSKLGDIKADKTFLDEVAAVGKRQAQVEKDFPQAANPVIQELRDAYAVKKFSAKGAVQAVRQLRADSAKNIKAPNAPEQNAVGYAQREVSDALESQLERHAEKTGNADLMAEFRAARQTLAKVHSVEAAMTPGSTNVLAHKLLQQRGRGAPLSGNLKKISDVAANFPEVTQGGKALKGGTPFSVLDLFVGGLGAAVNPYAAAAVAARPLARRALLSDAYQSRLKPVDTTLKNATRQASAAKREATLRSLERASGAGIIPLEDR